MPIAGDDDLCSSCPRKRDEVVVFRVTWNDPLGHRVIDHDRIDPKRRSELLDRARSQPASDRAPCRYALQLLQEERRRDQLERPSAPCVDDQRGG